MMKSKKRALSLFDQQTIDGYDINNDLFNPYAITATHATKNNEILSTRSSFLSQDPLLLSNLSCSQPSDPIRKTNQDPNLNNSTNPLIDLRSSSDYASGHIRVEPQYLPYIENGPYASEWSSFGEKLGENLENFIEQSLNSTYINIISAEAPETLTMEIIGSQLPQIGKQIGYQIGWEKDNWNAQMENIGAQMNQFFHLNLPGGLIYTDK